MTPTRLPDPGRPDVLYVIDLSGYIFRAYHALPPLSTSRGEPTHAVHGVTQMLLKMVKEQKPAMVAVAVDSKSTFRKEKLPTYKANRPPPPADLRQQIDRLRQIVDLYAIPVLAVEGYEADDVIASAVVAARARGWEVVICAADKDMMPLIGEGVVMWDTMRDRIYGDPETIEKMGVPPGQVRDLLALMGDSSDNIPGVPKVGQKTAAKLLADYGSIDGIYENLDAITKKAVKETLTENRDAAYLSRDLVTLVADLTVSLDAEALRWTGGDRTGLRKIFTELEMTRLLAQLDPEPIAAGSYEVVTTLAGVESAAKAARAAGRLAMFPVLVNAEDALRSDVVGLALAWKPGTAIYIPLTHRYIGVPEQPGVRAVLEVLKPLFEDASLPKVSDDLKRDVVLLLRHGVRIENGSFDTMIASYLLDPQRHGHGLLEIARAELNAELLTPERLAGTGKHKAGLDEIEVEKVAGYAGQRADFAVRLTDLLKPRMEHGEFRSLMYDLEVPLARVLADMERTGIRLDGELLRGMAKEVDARLHELERRCVELAGREFNVGSPRQLEGILFDELKLRVIKRTKTSRSTDSDVLEELAEEHDLPAVILEHRMLAKLKGTYLDALPRQADPKTGRIHTRYDQAVARTGRLSSNDPNLQNIPIRTEIGRRVREAFLPEAGWEILSADYSQIELRVLAHLSQDPDLCDAFAGDEDVHVRTATAIFGVAPEAVTRTQRDQAKTVNYAVIYGQSHFMLARNLKIERREAMRYIEAFFERYKGVAELMERTIEEGRNHGYVRTILGRRRSLPDIRSKNRSLRMAAERIARNTPIQGSAADIMKVAMVKIHDELRQKKVRSRMLLTVHDELVLEVPPEEKAEVGAVVKQRMEHALELSVPLLVELGWGPSWGKAK